MASSAESTTRTAQIRARYSVAQSSSVASPRVSASGPGERAGPAVHAQLDARLAQLAQHARQQLGGHVGVHRAGSPSRCTRPGRWTLALTAIASASSRSAVASTYTWQLPEAAYITGTVACSVSAAFRPSPPRGMIRSIRPVLGGDLAQLVAVAAGHERDRGLGQARRGERRPGPREASTAFEWAAVDEPAQHDGVAGLQAQRGAVDRHVRPRLVDHRHHPERHADAPQVEPVGEPVAVDAPRRPGSGQRRGSSRTASAMPSRRCSVSVSRSISAADRPASAPASTSRALAARISSARSLERERHRLQRGVLRARSRHGASARDADRACSADLGYRLGGWRPHPEGNRGA